MADDAISVARKVTTALDQLGIPYAIGGSVASSVHGLARTTNDVDIVAGVRAEHVAPLVAVLEDEFYIEPAAVKAATAQGASFNVIHFDTAFKVDVFVAGTDAFRQAEIARRQTQPLEGSDVYVLSPEDTVLAKLRWYDVGGRTSERPWRDVVGVVKVQGARLDAAYLQEWASRMGVGDLLAKALAEGCS